MAEYPDSKNFNNQGGVQFANEGPTIASAATIAPTFLKHIVSGTAAIVNITVPYTGFAGEFHAIPTGAFTWTAAGNIVTTGTATVGRPIVFTYLKSTAKWYPVQAAASS